MGNEHGEWIMHGVSPDAPDCLHTPEALLALIEKIGFLPLFENGIPGFSVEEHTVAEDWWSGDASRDPWEWRAILARSGKVAYGKFFFKKAGFISLKWLPDFLNCRRDGYDFDARWDDELASRRQKKIMDCFASGEAIPSFRLKELAGFSKGGEKNFDGTVGDLQAETYLCVSDFVQKTNSRGLGYGWAVAVYSRPEDLFGEKLVTESYKTDPALSRERIRGRVLSLYPDAPEKLIKKL